MPSSLSGLRGAFKSLAFTLFLATRAVATTTMAVYYGQGADQPRLSEFCSRSEIDVIPIGFVTKFPNAGKGGVIETNFANQCFSPAYLGTNFVYNCPDLAADIVTCQQAGKKVLLSIGGSSEVYLASAAEAQEAVEQIWSAFGPADPTWSYGRPFGDAVIDGFDLDLETGASKSDNGLNYETFAKLLRAKFSSDSSKPYYLSAAPQCPYPDATLGSVVANVALDYIFVQYYNNPICRATNSLSTDYQVSNAEYTNFNNWNSVAASNPGGNTQWFLGLIADPTAPDNVNQTDLSKILPIVMPSSNFGGIMLWEATAASLNVNLEGQDYITRVRDNLNGHVDPDDNPTTTTSSPTGTSTFGVSATAAPGQTHQSVVDGCGLWYEIVSGDTCATIVTKSNGILTLSDLQTWNQEASGDCSGLWANTWICVGLASSSTSTSSATGTSSTGAPSPTQANAGFAANCNAWDMVVKGDSCYAFATRNEITLDQLEGWNTILQGDGCSSSFWLGYNYCIGVSDNSGSTSSASTSASTSTSTSTPSSPSVPSPTQGNAGFDANCDTWGMAVSGDSCSTFATEHGITLEQLQQYNTILQGDGCSAFFWLGYNYCVGASDGSGDDSGSGSSSSSTSTSSSYGSSSTNTPDGGEDSTGDGSSGSGDGSSGSGDDTTGSGSSDSGSRDDNSGSSSSGTDGTGSSDGTSLGSDTSGTDESGGSTGTGTSSGGDNSSGGSDTSSSGGDGSDGSTDGSSSGDGDSGTGAHNSSSGSGDSETDSGSNDSSDYPSKGNNGKGSSRPGSGRHGQPARNPATATGAYPSPTKPAKDQYPGNHDHDDYRTSATAYPTPQPYKHYSSTLCTSTSTSTTTTSCTDGRQKPTVHPNWRKRAVVKARMPPRKLKRRGGASAQSAVSTPAAQATPAAASVSSSATNGTASPTATPSAFTGDAKEVRTPLGNMVALFSLVALLLAL